jgi:sec-independent protein translocase protein TatB
VLNVGFPELFVVGVLALLVFGPERLPELARNAANFINRFRDEASRSINDLREAADLGDIEKDIQSLRGELTGARDDLRRGLREPTEQMRNFAKEVNAGGPAEHTPAQARPTGPPPIDPEAT